MIGFTGLFDTEHGYTFQVTVTHTHTHTHTHTSGHNRIFTAVAWYRLSTTDFPLTLDIQAVPSPSYQLLAAAAHKEVLKLKICYNRRSVCRSVWMASIHLGYVTCCYS
jgi:hypothetical protein